jgi:hypothetical protein
VQTVGNNMSSTDSAALVLAHVFRVDDWNYTFVSATN